MAHENCHRALPAQPCLLTRTGAQDPMSSTNWRLLRRGFLAKCSTPVCCLVSLMCVISWGAASQPVSLTDVQVKWSQEPRALDTLLREKWHVQQQLGIMLLGSCLLAGSCVLASRCEMWYGWNGLGLSVMVQGLLVIDLLRLPTKLVEAYFRASQTGCRLGSRILQFWVWGFQTSISRVWNQVSFHSLKAQALYVADAICKPLTCPSLRNAMCWRQSVAQPLRSKLLQITSFSRTWTWATCPDFS